MTSSQHQRNCGKLLGSGRGKQTPGDEAMVFSWKLVDCLLRVGGESPPRVEEFDYFGVLRGNGAVD